MFLRIRSIAVDVNKNMIPTKTNFITRDGNDIEIIENNRADTLAIVIIIINKLILVTTCEKAQKQ